MDQFYITIDEFLAYGNLPCPDCKSDMWIQYGDGHMAYVCLDCDMPSHRPLDIPAYVTQQPVPSKPLPDWLEAKEVRNCWPGALPHERMYYRKVGKEVFILQLPDETVPEMYGYGTFQRAKDRATELGLVEYQIRRARRDGQWETVFESTCSQHK